MDNSHARFSEFTDIQVTDDGYEITGEKNIDTKGTNYTILVKYDFDYDIEWEKFYDEDGNLIE